MMKFYIVTPCLNAEGYIHDTVSSILSQTCVRSGDVELEYVIMDGGSNDATLEIVRSFDSSHVRVVSQPDTGMYDALARAFQQANGDVMAYLNAGDTYSPHALSIVAEFMQQYPAVQWLTGLNVTYNERGQFVQSMLPARYRARLFECGAYGRGLPHVQQESTFWKRSLLSCLDMDRLARFRLAGDYYIWRSFSSHATLAIVEAYLGGYRVHHGRKSADQELYRAEMNEICRQMSLVDHASILIDRLIASCAPVRIQKRLNNSQLFRFCHETQRWK